MVDMSQNQTNQKVSRLKSYIYIYIYIYIVLWSQKLNEKPIINAKITNKTENGKFETHRKALDELTG